MALPIRELTLAEAITFTRASKAWYFDSAGVHQEAAVDAIRDDHDPGDSNARQGIALEGASTNLLTYSEDLSNGAWTRFRATIGTPISFATNISLDELVEDSTASKTHYFLRTFTVTSGAVTTISAICKKNARDRCFVRLLDSSGNGVDAVFNLTSGAIDVGPTDRGTATNTDADIVDFGGGVYRISVTMAASGSTSYDVVVFMDNGTTDTYTGDGTSSLYIGALQAEQRPFASSYIPTVASQVTRAQESAEVASLDPWYRSGGYGFEVEAKLRAAGGAIGSTQVLSISNGTNANRVEVQARGTSTRLLITTAGASTIGIAGATTDYTRFRVAVRMSSGDSAISIDGGAAVANASNAPPPATVVKLGRSAINTRPIYGWLRDLKYVTDPVLIASDYTDAELANRSAEYAS